MGIALVFVGGQYAQAAKATFKKSLSSVPAPEMPQTAATLIAQSTAEEREATAQSVVEAALELSPATAPELVGSISRQNPALAPTVAALAATRQPQLAALIAKAAASSAPKYAGQIVAAICKKQPAACEKVALEVVRAVPQAGPAIIAGLLDVLPNLKPYIDKGVAMAGGNGSAQPSELLVLSYAFASLDKAASTKGVTTPVLLAQTANTVPVGAPFESAASGGSEVPVVPDGSLTGDPRGGASPLAPGTRQDHNYSRP